LEGIRELGEYFSREDAYSTKMPVA
jgi:hypothetical protein